MAAVRGTFVAIVDLVAAAEGTEATVLGSTAQGDVAEDSDLVLSGQNAKFDVMHLAFDAVTGRNLAVAGLRTVQVSHSGLCILAYRIQRTYFSVMPCQSNDRLARMSPYGV